MVEPVTSGAFVGLRRGALVLFANLVLAVAPALGDDGVPDPTRPPNMSPGASPGASGAGPILQAVRISHGRTLAIVDGQSVRVGDTVGGLKVLRITEGGVVLGGGGQSRTLTLFPEVQKRGRKPASGINSENQRKEDRK